MIGKLSGILDYKGSDHALIDVNGVGYEVFLSDRTLAVLPHSGNKISIFTELIVREDMLQLVGFLNVNERAWYRLLTSVQGVGSKAALKILGTVTISLLSRAILTGDVSTIKATPGIGPKIAQRIVSELKEKAPTLMAISTGLETETKDTAQSHQSIIGKPALKGEEIIDVGDGLIKISSQIQSESLSALSNLGYSSHDAALAITNVLIDDESITDVEQLIRLALKHLAPKG